MPWIKVARCKPCLLEPHGSTEALLRRDQMVRSFGILADAIATQRTSPVNFVRAG